MDRSYHHGNLRAALLEHGVKLVEEKGVNGLTLREIGDRAGVSRTAPYRHFADKAELLAAIREQGFAEFAESLESARRSIEGSAEGNAVARLRAMGLAYIRFAESRGPYYEVMFGAGCEGPVNSPAGERAFAVLVSAIEEGQSSGEFRAGDPAFLARVVWALSHGVAMLRLGADADHGMGGFMSAAGEVLINGLKPE